jgi:SAM-dependent methyltransferase
MRLAGITSRAREFVYNIGHAIARLLGPTEHEALLSALSRPDLVQLARELLTDIPQAVSHDDTVTACEHRDWRAHFASKLQGSGLEIGALSQPMVTHAGMRVQYVDRHTTAELREEYASLGKGHLKRFVEPDIVDDGTRLTTIADATHDFLIAAHVIEHLTDPIGALANWARVVRPGGLVYLVVPDKRGSFDRRRVRTTLEHLILDYRRPSRERDYEHFLDYAIHVHRSSGDPAIAEADRLLATDFSIHFHVFQPADLVAMVRWFAGNVRPLEIVEGPVVDPAAAEFHLLLKTG